MEEIIKIDTEDDYREALSRFLQICESQKTNEELKEMLLLMDLMGKYERENCGGS